MKLCVSTVELLPVTDEKSMKIAVITPVTESSMQWLHKCCQSVLEQNVTAEHVIICDSEFIETIAKKYGATVLKLPKLSEKNMDSAKSIGALFAISQGAGAISWLNANAYFHADHLSKLLELHESSGASVCTSKAAFEENSTVMLTNDDSTQHEFSINSNCYFITQDAFELVSIWSQIREDLHHLNENIVWEHIRLWGMTYAHSETVSVSIQSVNGNAIPKEDVESTNLPVTEILAMRRLYRNFAASPQQTIEITCADSVKEATSVKEAVSTVTEFNTLIHTTVNKKCVVLVPVGNYVEPACESGLRELEKRGYEVWRWRGYSAIDQARNQMATDALAAGFEETMWIDADVAFHADDVERLRNHNLPIVAGIYPKKGRREFAMNTLPRIWNWRRVN
jgi:hypothetical protein